MRLHKARKQPKKSPICLFLLRLKQLEVRGECFGRDRGSSSLILGPRNRVPAGKLHWPAALPAEAIRRVPRGTSPPGTSLGRAAGVRRRQDAEAEAWALGRGCWAPAEGIPTPSPAPQAGDSATDSKRPAAPRGTGRKGPKAIGGGTSLGARAGAHSEGPWLCSCRVLWRPLSRVHAAEFPSPAPSWALARKGAQVWRLASSQGWERKGEEVMKGKKWF